MVSLSQTKHILAGTTSAGSGASDLAERMRWVASIRWTLVVALLLVGLIGGTAKSFPAESIYANLGLALLVAAYNLFYLYLSISQRQALGKSRFLSALRLAQIPIDLLVFTAIIHFSGGVKGPVFVLYFLYIFVGLAILPPSGAYVVAALAAACYAGLALLEAYWVAPPNAQAFGRLPEGPDPLLTYLGYVLTVSAMLMIIAYIANYFAGLLTRGERTILQQLNEINTLYSFTRTMSSTLNAEEAMQALVARAMELEGADAGSLLLINDRSEAVFAVTRGFRDDEVSRYFSRPMSMDSKSIRLRLAEGRGIYAPEVDAFPDLRSILPKPETISFYSIPIYNEEKLIGSLSLSFERHYTMPMSHWNLLSAMSQQAALAIERARLFADTQRSAKEMTSLYHIGLVTTSSLDINEVLHLIYEQVKGVVRSDTFYIALYDEDQGELRYDLFIESAKALPPFRARVDSVGIPGWVIRNRKPLFIRHWSEEVEQLPFEAGMVGAPTQSVISVPLIAKNKIVGVMSVQAVEPNAFDDNHLRLLTAIASQAALALENARLHATVNEQAQRDPLTGVFHHGSFIDRLNAAIEHARAHNESLALIMLDIDRFKQYNDTYGHLVGDDVLRSTVEAIQNHLKNTDVVGRWGGEEFGIVLRNVTRAQARAVAERIRQTVESNIMKDTHNRQIPSPTVSQGIALFPEDATEIEELIDKADFALFRAKDQGRNRIAQWVDSNHDGVRRSEQLQVGGK